MALRWKLTIVLAGGAAMAALVVAHVPGLNGPWYWVWPWRRLGWGTYPLILAASSPVMLAQWLHARRGVRPARLVWLLMLATLLMQAASLLPQPPGKQRLCLIVQSSVNTSYYDAARVLVKQMDRQGKSYRDWLEIYPDLMKTLMLHASFKPPGLIFYYIAMIRLFGLGPASAWAGGIGLALLACGSVAATYWLLHCFLADPVPAFHGAAYFAFIPSLILFIPQYDQAYPIVACLMLITWAAALRRRWVALAFGGVLAFSLFLSATFLLLGLFLAIYTILYMGDGGMPAVVRVFERTVLAVLTVIVLYLGLYAATGYDPIATLTTGGRLARGGVVALQRPWPRHYLFDFIDIALGIGWIGVALIAFGAVQAWRERHRGGAALAQWRMIWIGLLQIVMGVLVAVFPGENARLMLPLMPLLMPAIGLELSRWPLAYRIAVYVTLALIVAVICQNMIFLYMGPEIEGVPRA